MRVLLSSILAVVLAGALGFASWHLAVPTVQPRPGASHLPRLLPLAGLLSISGVFLGAAFSRPFRLGGLHPLLLGILMPLLLGILIMVPVFALLTTEIAEDVKRDPTSHNLLPFEYLIFAIMGIAPVTGAFVGHLVGRSIGKERA
jgi:hypothetical protein